MWVEPNRKKQKKQRSSTRAEDSRTHAYKFHITDKEAAQLLHASELMD
jgi:hypothetical protein